MGRGHFDVGRYKWREVTGEPGLSYKVRHDYTILGYDLAAGTLDMVVRWAGDGGHCPIHRHLATTTVLVDPETGARFMAVDGIEIGGNGITEYKQQLLAHVPKLLLDDVSLELSIGLGSGMLAGESLRHASWSPTFCANASNGAAAMSSSSTTLPRPPQNPALQLEERDLKDALGEDYIAYRARTPMVIPFLKFGKGAAPDVESQE